MRNSSSGTVAPGLTIGKNGIVFSNTASSYHEIQNRIRTSGIDKRNDNGNLLVLTKHETCLVAKEEKAIRLVIKYRIN